MLFGKAAQLRASPLGVYICVNWGRSLFTKVLTNSGLAYGFMDVEAKGFISPRSDAAGRLSHPDAVIRTSI